MSTDRDPYLLNTAHLVLQCLDQISAKAEATDTRLPAPPQKKRGETLAEALRAVSVNFAVSCARLELPVADRFHTLAGHLGTGAYEAAATEARAALADLSA